MIEVGKTYRAKGHGRAISPQSVDAHVVWVDDKDVHYRLTGSLKVLQTPLERFRDIVEEEA